MEMPTIRIDDEVWRYLQGKAKAFVDTPNDVLRRAFGLDQSRSLNSSTVRPDDEKRDTAVAQALPSIDRPSRLSTDRDYSHQLVRGYQIDGVSFSAHSFKDVLVGLSNHLRRKHGSDFDKVALSLRGRKRKYFSRSAGDLKFPEPLAGGGLFVETNLNANLLIGICIWLLQGLGYDPNQFRVE